jgi:hypothetical protein
MRFFILLLLSFPCLLFAQATKEDYTIYSQYLKNYSLEKGHKMKFVVRESTDYDRKYDTAGIKDIVINLRKYLKGDVAAGADANLFPPLADTLKKDTTWLSLIITLSEKIKDEFILKNTFSKSLHTDILTNSDYSTIFNNPKDLEKEWVEFHQRYSKSAVIVEFSAITHNKNRAVFYFIKSGGSLGAAGYLIFGYKKGKRWKFILVQPLWES